jgi:hypothetical protein
MRKFHSTASLRRSSHNNALIAVERNNHGQAVLAHLDASEHYDGAKVYEIKTNMRWLLGNGKPGKLQELTDRVDRHERVVQRFTGIGGALAGLVTLVHIGLDYFRTH